MPGKFCCIVLPRVITVIMTPSKGTAVSNNENLSLHRQRLLFCEVLARVMTSRNVIYGWALAAVVFAARVSRQSCVRVFLF